MRKPIAVLISDLHFRPDTLELASTALIRAKDEAERLGIPLVLGGDTLDSKDIIRGVCANRLIQILNDSVIPIIVNVGNHDLLNEKGTEHALNFLKPYAKVVEQPQFIRSLDSYVIPYFSDKNLLRSFLNTLLDGTRLIMHQGVNGANMGHYVKDTSSLPAEVFSRFRVISGHYHEAQTIVTGSCLGKNIGRFSYIGNPYTLNFGEAEDGPKGFQILYDDGSLELVPLDLRKHLILETTTEELLHYTAECSLRATDLLWLKVTGPFSELEKLNKDAIGKALIGHSNFKFDTIPTDSPKLTIENTEYKTNPELMDTLIEQSDESLEQKEDLKSLWRELMT